MILSIVKNEESGHVVFISLIMVLISMGFTLGYFQFVMGERYMHYKNLAEAQARLNSISSIGQLARPFIRSASVADTTFEDKVYNEEMPGYYDIVEVRYVLDPRTGEYDVEGTGRGISTFNDFDGEPVEVEKWTKIRYRPETFADYMYFSNEELPGPVWYGSNVNFRGPDQIEGIVFSNDNITMNSTCPSFVNGANGELSKVMTAGHFVLNGCNEDQIFEGYYAEDVEPVEWPPFSGHDKVKDAARWIFSADDFIYLNGPDPDMLVMTDIEFTLTGFIITQWQYAVPPYIRLAPFAPTYMEEYVEPYQFFYPFDYQSALDPWLPSIRAGFTGGGYSNHENWSFYDYPDYPMTIDPADPHFVRHEVYSAHDGVIWIEGGQVRVHGVVNGRFTVATSSPTTYRMYHSTNMPNPVLAEMKNNIWIMGDIKYADAGWGGAVPAGSTNRLGLLSAGDIIVANTPENGAGNRASGANVIINAAMIAMDASFTIQYWQNSTSGYNALNGGLIKGDDLGLDVNGGTTTGNNDIRGNVTIWGSVTQARRGYLKRNQTGAYQIWQGIGYDKDYHYDYNLREFPPPAWPENANADGSRNMAIEAFGGYDPE